MQTQFDHIVLPNLKMHPKIIQNRGLRCIHNIPTSRAKSHHIADLLQRQSRMRIPTYKTVTGDAPPYLG